MKAEYLDHMGDDLAVVDAARVSFDKQSEWDFRGITMEGPTKILKPGDKKLINYLASHNHWTPFSHVVIKMREEVPIFVARQRFKHMVGFTYNEVSRRYVSGEPEFYVPDMWRKAAENKKQGSTDDAVTHMKNSYWFDQEDKISHVYEDLMDAAEEVYRNMLAAGVCPEQARMVLPQSMYTSYIVTGSLAAWARAYKLRIDPHAQKEIQDLASQWGDIIGNIPELQHSWKALTND